MGGREGLVTFEYSGGDKSNRVRITDDSVKVGHGRYEVIGHTWNSSRMLLSSGIRRRKVW